MSADLVEFLTARLDEDEGIASGIEGEDPHSRGCWAVASEPQSCDCGWPAKILADVEAKRGSLALHAECGTGVGYCDDGGHGYADGRCRNLDLLASVYADHPDYKQEWKP